jgi:hypothetical protein
VEFLEKELNINDAAVREENGSGCGARKEKTRSQSKEPNKKPEDATQNSKVDAEAEEDKVKTEIAEIEDMLAQLKKELGM